MFYSLSMLSYGSLEMTHDLLHWMASHYHSGIHDHDHGHHHTFQDHEHHHDHDHVTKDDSHDADQTELPFLIHFFGYYQQETTFQFYRSLSEILEGNNVFPLKYIYNTPPTPPPLAA
jgi:hypothetical protein